MTCFERSTIGLLSSSMLMFVDFEDHITTIVVLEYTPPTAYTTLCENNISPVRIQKKVPTRPMHAHQSCVKSFLQGYKRESHAPGVMYNSTDQICLSFFVRGHQLNTLFPLQSIFNFFLSNSKPNHLSAMFLTVPICLCYFNGSRSEHYCQTTNSRK